MIPKSFYDRNARIVAKQIFGKTLIKKVGLYGRIVETESFVSR
ncbi:MAG: DNA-3-methyladenine glycosylase [Candidatus Thermoplasmatota archaeon]|nr:DNA-3-methyladenine glycosylase [Candidatus Thermoplasmatota archaeon]